MRHLLKKWKRKKQPKKKFAKSKKKPQVSSKSKKGKDPMIEDDNVENLQSAENQEALLAQAKKDDIASKKTKAAQKANVEQASKMPVSKRAKKGKSAQANIDVQDVIQEIKPIPSVPQRKTTDILAVDYKSMPLEQCRDARFSCSYSRRSNSTDSRFHERIQQDFYETVLLQKKPKVVQMRYTDWKYIDSKGIFSNIHADCEIVKVAKLMALKQDWNEELILQFYATVQFEDQSDKSFTWMSNGKQYSSNIYEFAKLLKLLANNTPDYESVHQREKYDKSNMQCLYDVNFSSKDNKKKKVLGTTTGLHQGIFTLNYLLRYSLDPKVGDTTNIRGFSKKLLVLIDQHIPFNVMDYLFERIKAASYDQEKSCPFAPYIQKLINHVVKDQKFTMDTKHKPCQLERELSMFDPKNLQAPKPKIKRAKSSTPQATHDDAGTSSAPKTLEEKLEHLSTKEIMAMFAKSQLKVNESLERSLYLQEKLRIDHDQIKFALNKLLVKQEL